MFTDNLAPLSESLRKALGMNKDNNIVPYFSKMVKNGIPKFW